MLLSSSSTIFFREHKKLSPVYYVGLIELLRAWKDVFCAGDVMFFHLRLVIASLLLDGLLCLAHFGVLFLYTVCGGGGGTETMII